MRDHLEVTQAGQSQDKKPQGRDLSRGELAVGKFSGSGSSGVASRQFLQSLSQGVDFRWIQCLISRGIREKETTLRHAARGPPTRRGSSPPLLRPPLGCNRAPDLGRLGCPCEDSICMGAWRGKMWGWIHSHLHPPSPGCVQNAY